MRPSTGTLLLCLVLAAGPGSCQTNESGVPYNAILIVSDALRPDVLGCYGGGASTPNIDWLAANGVVFDNAFSTSTWTGPSSVSMFTGNYPSSYPSRMALRGKREGIVFGVPDNDTLFTEILSSSGYHTACYLENKVPVHNNLLQGYKTLLLTKPLSLRETKEIEETLGTGGNAVEIPMYPTLRFLFDSVGGGCFFLYIWLLDPHSPYNPPTPHADRLDGDWTALPQKPAFYRRIGSTDLKEYARNIEEAERVYLRHLYLGEVESVDGRIGLILQTLRQTGLLDRTFIILTSDHGEAFGEHGKYCHGGGDFYRVMTHVPLLLVGPGIPAGRRVRAPVSHVGLAPTLMDLLGKAPGQDVQGKSFTPLVRSESSEIAPVFFTNGTSDDFALMDSDWKLVQRNQELTLFDVAVDPEEVKDLSGRYPEVVATMLSVAHSLIGDCTRRRSSIEQQVKGEKDSAEEENANERLLKELKSLGYIR